MRGSKRALILLLTTVLVLVTAVFAAAALTRTGGNASPDLPSFVPDSDANANYLRLRDEYVAHLRGIEPGQFFNPLWRTAALQLERQQRIASPQTATWTEIGPDTVPNGQSLQGTDTAVSGRVTAIAVDPTDSNTIYLGAAHGGVWRTTNGGTSWTPIFDAAQSLAVGALALAPSSPTTLYVGTGEASFSCDSFFGVGLYRIDSAKTTATLVGPLNKDGSANDVFTGNAISAVLVDPTNAATVFVSTKRGFSGMGCNTGATIPTLGVYRSTNATGAAPAVTFTRLTVQPAAFANRDVNSMAFVNGDPTTLLVHVYDFAGTAQGGVWRSTNALDATPSFTRTLAVVADNAAFAVTGNTVLVGDDESGLGGRLRESTDGGATWPTLLSAANGYCGGQCFYDLPVGVDPATSGASLRIYIGGSAGTGSAAGMKVSNDNGTTFSVDQTGLHADAHAIVMDAATVPTTVWAGNDGGVWKRAANASVGTTWTNENHSLGTLQFQSVAVGSSDPFFGIGGTQDNGTELQQTSLGTWSQADFGDGGYALIDQSTTSTSTVTMYHTYFNQTSSLIGFGRVTTAASAVKGGWSFLGCQNPTSNNGIVCTNNVEFYAPMALGPGTPNTLYFGTDRLYRSANSGTTMSCGCASSISGGSPITTIAVSPQDDNYRIVGLENGQVWATTTGSSTLSQMTGLTAPTNANGSSTNKWVGRVAFDPNDKNTAYVTFDYYASTGAGSNVWKTTNLNNATPTWAAAASGIPNVPVNAFVVDPNNSQHLYAGTDIGVYSSTDGGTSWAPYGTGLPVVAVFDMAIVQPGTTSERLRIATHGRSMWQITVASNPTAVGISSFAATRTTKGVAVTWRTRTEAQIAGFNVFRNGVKLNRTLIAAKHAGQTGGAAYRFFDRAALRGVRYVYRLQVLAPNGTRAYALAPVAA